MTNLRTTVSPKPKQLKLHGSNQQRNGQVL